MTTHLKKNLSAPLVRIIGLALVASIIAALATPMAPAAASPSSRATLIAAKGSADALFGTSVSVDGNTAVVGAPDEGGVGAAYVFTKREGGG